MDCTIKQFTRLRAHEIIPGVHSDGEINEIKVNEDIGDKCTPYTHPAHSTCSYSTHTLMRQGNRANIPTGC